MNLNTKDDDAEKLSPDLLERLHSMREVLAERGTVILRREKGRRDSYRIRVRAYLPHLGYRKMLAIRLRDEAEATAVRELLATWRAEQAKPRVIAKREEQRRRRDYWERRAENAYLKLMVPKHCRRRVVKEYGQVRNLGPIQATLYLLSRSYLKEPVRRRAYRTPLLDPANQQPLPVQQIVRQSLAERRKRLGLPEPDVAPA